MSSNPILNNPFEEPRLHYGTSLAGELDYGRVEEGRRPFTPDFQAYPVRSGPQSELGEVVDDLRGRFGSHPVNLLRQEVGVWRGERYPNTTRVTRELLTYWFLDPERENHLFFAQREAIETAIYLNEVAERSNPGQHILSTLTVAQRLVHAPEQSLPRFAFKMATGTGKTVVMAALIAYHFCNRQEYRSDPRFADNFLVVAPGVTIRDRLAVLRVAAEGDEAGLLRDYYSERLLVPHSLRSGFAALNAHLAIVNFQAFQPRTLSGNKRSPFDGKRQADGSKLVAEEEPQQVLRRLLPSFRPGSRILVLNDEAHHCYLPAPSLAKVVPDAEAAAEENERAAVWFTGLGEVARRFKLRAVYDLSATPYFLSGSGYDAYTLFPWVVSDFGLTEAIESGLVKIPFLPTRDDSNALGEPVLRNLYEHLRDDLPRAGRRTSRKRVQEHSELAPDEEAPPRVPQLLQAALDQFYEHYREEFGKAGQLTLEGSPPVFIVVCNNTSVSKEVFKFIAGYERTRGSETEPGQVVTGHYDLFSNFDEQTRRPHDRPRTLLIDSDALENSGQIDDGFKRVFAAEIEQFKRDYARVHGAGAAETIDEADILREVVNTVGRRGTLGQHIRCVVSVSMLTEGWDANTVTHIVGVRAFGSQLLCEQVAGRALRRRSYQLAPYDPGTGERLDDRAARRRRAGNVLWKFPPEYAHVIGVPFKLFKSGAATAVEPQDLTRFAALPERAALEITFPLVEGYRLLYPEGPLRVDFSQVPDYVVEAARIPTETALASAVSSGEVSLTLEQLLERRDQPVVFRIAKDLLRDHFSSDPTAPEFQRFGELVEIVRDWYENHVRVLGRGPEWRKLLYYADPRGLVAHIARGIQPGDAPHERVRPILRHHNSIGSTRFVRGTTSRECYPVRFSQVSHVVIDSGWEGRAAKVLDLLAEEGRLQSWVKNHALNFRIPYVDAAGESRDYLPDFILAHTRGGRPARLIVEITGARRDKPEKVWTVRERWLPAVNNAAAPGAPVWDFLEIDGEEAVEDLRNRLVAHLDRLPGDPVSAAFGAWKNRNLDGLEYERVARSEWDEPAR